MSFIKRKNKNNFTIRKISKLPTITEETSIFKPQIEILNDSDDEINSDNIETLRKNIYDQKNTQTKNINGLNTQTTQETDDKMEQEQSIEIKKKQIKNCFISKGLLDYIPQYELQRLRFNLDT